MKTSFQLVKITLDQLYALISRKHGVDTDALIKRQLASLSGQYKDLTKAGRQPIDYADPLTRFAYVYAYVAAHSSYVRDMLLSAEETRVLLKRVEDTRVTCVGGGPGSELVGLIQACALLNKQGRLVCSLLDREDAWAETWDDVDGHLDDVSFRVTTMFRQFDVTREPDFGKLTKAFAADLFVLSFFLSEVYAFRDQIKPFFEELIAAMKPGSLVVYIDNHSPQFDEFADGTFSGQKFEVLRSGSEWVLPPSTEEKSDLGDYLEKFARTPKLRSNVSHRLWKKL